MNDRTAALVDNALEIFVYLFTLGVLGWLVSHGQTEYKGPFEAVVGVLLGRGVRGIVSPRPSQPVTTSTLPVVPLAPVAPPAVAAPTSEVKP